MPYNLGEIRWSAQLLVVIPIIFMCGVYGSSCSLLEKGSVDAWSNLWCTKTVLRQASTRLSGDACKTLVMSLVDVSAGAAFFRADSVAYNTRRKRRERTLPTGLPHFRKSGSELSKCFLQRLTSFIFLLCTHPRGMCSLSMRRRSFRRACFTNVEAPPGVVGLTGGWGCPT